MSRLQSLIKEAEANVLLESFTDRLRNQLQDVAIAAIRPAISVEVEKAIAELKPQIQAHFDTYANRMVVELLLREIPR